eukprot:2640900-Rhodomonas_salina.1
MIGAGKPSLEEAQDSTIVVTIAFQTISTKVALFTYGAAQMSSLLNTNAPATGSISITTFGGSIAAADYSPAVRIGTSMGTTAWNSDCLLYTSDAADDM